MSVRAGRTDRAIGGLVVASPGGPVQPSSGRPDAVPARDHAELEDRVAVRVRVRVRPGVQAHRAVLHQLHDQSGRKPDLGAGKKRVLYGGGGIAGNVTGGGGVRDPPKLYRKNLFFSVSISSVVFRCYS